MIQDIYDPEFYLGLYQVEDLETSRTFQKSGMYKDIADCSVSLCYCKGRSLCKAKGQETSNVCHPVEL